MSIYKVKKLNKPIDAEVSVPGSKSITNRALFISALSDSGCILCNPLFSDDTESFLGGLKDLGYEVKVCNVSSEEENEPYIKIEKSQSGPLTGSRINVGSAGTTARFLTAFLGISEGTFHIDASEQMRKRPMKALFDTLVKLGARIEYANEEFHLPVTITGEPDIKTNEITVECNESTQFLSALLMIAPLLAQRTGKEFVINAMGQRALGAYVKMTVRIMESYGVHTDIRENDGNGAVFSISPGCNYSRSEYHIEPDVSAACYFYGAAALTGGRVLVKNVYLNSMQGDIKFLNVLEKMGCSIREKKEGVEVQGPKEKLKGISIDMRDFSDQTMTLSAMAPFCESKVEIKNVAHIRKQESDRISAIAGELKRMGIKVKEWESGIEIEPGEPEPALINTYNDHRMAMAFSLVGLMADGIEIDNYECCSKTFHNYFDKLDNITN